MALSSRSTARVETNRSWFTAAELALADGLFAMAEAVIRDADVPDAPPYGVGLREGGGAIAYVGKKKVAQMTTGAPTAPKKPRGSKPLREGEISAYGGFGFPARFVEIGTVHSGAEPFVTPSLMAEVPETHDYLRKALKNSPCTRKGK